MDSTALEYISRLRNAVKDESSLGRLSDWIVRNTTLFGKPFSFKDHEFQREIIDSTAYLLVVKKASQVGLSEVMARTTLGFLATMHGSVAIFLQPTVHEALRFAKSRVDPVIAGAKVLSSSMRAGNDSSSFKQIGDSQLFFGGTFGKSIISIPTDFLCIDEIDFSNQEALATAESRLSHSRFIDPKTGIRGFRRKFSTPTADGVGISALFDNSNEYHRLVRCPKCYEHFWPNFLQNCVVDGFDDSFEDLSYMDVLSLEDRGLVDTARLLCPKCHHALSKSDLGPDNREWVAKSPSAAYDGYAVSPFDLPAYHTPASIMRKMTEYKTHIGHFRNFTLGAAYSDESNSIVDEVVVRNTVLTPVPPDQARSLGVSGCVAGLDIGKISWMMIGKVVDKRMHVLWVQQISLRSKSAGTEGETLQTQVISLLNAYGVLKLVCDALPYTDTILNIQSNRPEGWVVPCVYTLSDRNIAPYVVSEKTQTVSAHRTKTLDCAVQGVNKGDVVFPACEEMRIVRNHFQGMKRVDQTTDEGFQSRWVKGGEDHYFHALNYLTMAAQMLGETASFKPYPGFIGAEVGSKSDPVESLSKEPEKIVLSPDNVDIRKLYGLL